MCWHSFSHGNDSSLHVKMIDKHANLIVCFIFILDILYLVVCHHLYHVIYILG